MKAFLPIFTLFLLSSSGVSAQSYDSNERIVKVGKYIKHFATAKKNKHRILIHKYEDSSCKTRLSEDDDALIAIEKDILNATARRTFGVDDCVKVTAHPLKLQECTASDGCERGKDLGHGISEEEQGSEDPFAGSNDGAVREHINRYRGYSSDSVSNDTPAHKPTRTISSVGSVEATTSSDSKAAKKKSKEEDLFR